MAKVNVCNIYVCLRLLWQYLSNQKVTVLYNAIMETGKQDINPDTPNFALGLYYIKVHTVYAVKQIPLQVINLI